MVVVVVIALSAEVAVVQAAGQGRVVLELASCSFGPKLVEIADNSPMLEYLVGAYGAPVFACSLAVVY